MRCVVSWAPPAPTQLPTVPANGTAGEGTGVPCAPHIPGAVSGNTLLFAGEARAAPYPWWGSAGKEGGTWELCTGFLLSASPHGDTSPSTRVWTLRVPVPEWAVRAAGLGVRQRGRLP